VWSLWERPALATAGSGDVLSGLMVGNGRSGPHPFEAAALVRRIFTDAPGALATPTPRHLNSGQGREYSVNLSAALVIAKILRGAPSRLTKPGYVGRPGVTS